MRRIEIVESRIAAQFVELRIDVEPRKKCIVRRVRLFQPLERRIAIAERRIARPRRGNRFDPGECAGLRVFQWPDDGERVGPAAGASVACGQERLAPEDRRSRPSGGSERSRGHVLPAETVRPREVELREGRIGPLVRRRPSAPRSTRRIVARWSARTRGSSCAAATADRARPRGGSPAIASSCRPRTLKDSPYHARIAALA